MLTSLIKWEGEQATGNLDTISEWRVPWNLSPASDATAISLVYPMSTILAKYRNAIGAGAENKLHSLLSLSPHHTDQGLLWFVPPLFPHNFLS